MLLHKQTILWIGFLFCITSSNISKFFIEGAEVVISNTSNATIEWKDRHLNYDKVYNPESAIITNDVRWYDHLGKPIKANRCGTISHKKINDHWYMVGSESHKKFSHGGDIFLYKSKTLGSDSWQRVKIIHEFDLESNSTSSSCEITQRYDDPNIFILHCRWKVFISYNGIEGDYTMHILDKPRHPGRGKLKFGGSSIYQEDKNLYLATSRLRITSDGARTRSTYIYKMNNTWTGFDKEFPSLTWKWDKFESPMLLKRGKWYYVFASRNLNWKESGTYYRRSRSIKGLANAADSKVVMHPANTPDIKSMGSQFCFLQKFGDGIWMFGGRRHPAESPENFAWQYGKNIMVPAKFINQVPHVYWKYKFNWTKYDYNKPSHDEHEHFGYGHKTIPCVDSPKKFWVHKGGRDRSCGWGKKQDRQSKCKKHIELQIKCPVTCKTFGCK